jgi:hypothetical protein
MFFNAIRFVHNTPVARLYYVVRGLDVSGQGWVDLPHNDLAKASGLSDSRIRALLKQGEELGWFTKVKREGGRTFVMYASDSRFARQHGSEFGTLNKALLKDSAALAARVTQVRVLYEQYRVESKLHRAIWTTKLGFKPLLDQLDDRVQVTANSRGLRNKVIYVGKEVYTVGLSQEELATRLSIPLSTLRLHLKEMPHTIPYREISTKEALEDDGYIICDEENQRFYRRMPNYYVDNLTKKAEQRRRLALRFDKLDPNVIEIAKLSAINMGYSYSRKGAIKAISRTGFRKFFSNLDPLLRSTPQGQKKEDAKAEWFRKKLTEGTGTENTQNGQSQNKPKLSKLQQVTAKFFGLDTETI